MARTKKQPTPAGPSLPNSRNSKRPAPVRQSWTPLSARRRQASRTHARNFSAPSRAGWSR